MYAFVIMIDYRYYDFRMSMYFWEITKITFYVVFFSSDIIIVRFAFNEVRLILTALTSNGYYTCFFVKKPVVHSHRLSKVSDYSAYSTKQESSNQ